MPLDLLVTGGRIATLAGDQGFGWVEAVGITDGRSRSPGPRSSLETRADPHTRRIELDPDEVAIPGLTDAHLHLAEGGLVARPDRPRRQRDARGRPRRSSPPPTRAADPDAWLEGHGWHNDRWGVWPTADDLERVAPGRRHGALGPRPPRALGEPRGAGDRRRRPATRPIRRAGSSAGTRTASRRASSTRRRRGSSSTTAPPPSPELVEIVDRAASPTTWSGWASWRSTTRAGCRSRTASGSGSRPTARSTSADELPLRVHASIRVGAARGRDRGRAARGDPLGPVGGRARFGWLKLFADGTLASRTAALLEPIEPEEGRPLPAGTERGIWLTPPERGRRVRPPGGRGRDRDAGPRDRRPGLPG